MVCRLLLNESWLSAEARRTQTQAMLNKDRKGDDAFKMRDNVRSCPSAEN